MATWHIKGHISRRTKKTYSNTVIIYHSDFVYTLFTGAYELHDIEYCK